MYYCSGKNGNKIIDNPFLPPTLLQANIGRIKHALPKSYLTVIGINVLNWKDNFNMPKLTKKAIRYGQIIEMVCF